MMKPRYSLPEFHATDEKIYHSRRDFLALGALGAISPLFSNQLGVYDKAPKSLTPTPYDLVTSYNNFYEFGTSKDDPESHAKSLKCDPWSIVIDGEVEKPITLDINTLLTHPELEERIYRLRCVEGWSMVIPWVGLELREVLKYIKPLSSARYVRFETLADEDQMRAVGGIFPSIPFPYVEGLRMDEALHPLTILAVGLYGRKLPPQNGAPIRLVVPWKYGFKSIKSIVRITLTKSMPKSTWNIVTPHEYGFYANVNPQVSHPRWSQRKERVIGSFARRKTEFLNGYAKEVGHLYSGMDLKQWF